MSPETHDAIMESEEYSAVHGINLLNTCTPYQVGSSRSRVEHCAWMESSAVIYINSVLGARTNTEGRESHGGGDADRQDPLLGLPHR